MKQELDIAERVAGGERFPLPARLQAAEGLVTEGILDLERKNLLLICLYEIKKVEQFNF